MIIQFFWIPDTEMNNQFFLKYIEKCKPSTLAGLAIQQQILLFSFDKCINLLFARKCSVPEPASASLSILFRYHKGKIR